MADLAAFLSEERKHCWQWGIKDCTSWVGDWILLNRGVDIFAPWRGTYNNSEECASLLASEGGLITLTRRVLKGRGFKRTTVPQCGDIGIVRAPALENLKIVNLPAGAVCVAPDRWAVRTIDKGIVIADLPMVVAWKI